jgi:NADH:ubiquinone oxidoreductase subunit 2 (subunit N)
MFNMDSQYFSVMLVSVLLLLFLISTYNNSVKTHSIKQEQITLLLLLLIAVSSLSSSVTIIALFASVEVQSLVLYLVLSTKVDTPTLLTNNHSAKPSIVYLFNASCATALLLYSISITSPLLLLVSILWKLGTMPVHA